MLKIVCLVILASLAQGCVHQITPSELSKVNNVLIMSALEDKFYVNEVDFNPFDKKGFEGDISSWNLRAEAEKVLAEGLSRPDRKVIVWRQSEHPEVALSWSTKSLPEKTLADLRREGFDAVIWIRKFGFRSSDPSRWEIDFTRGGFGFRSTSSLKEDISRCVFVSIEIEMRRISDNQRYMPQGLTICPNDLTLPAAREFAQYSEAEREILRNKITGLIRGPLARIIKKLGTPGSAAP